jgi:hypothetical protein
MATLIPTSHSTVTHSSHWTQAQRTVDQSRTWFLTLTALAAMSNIIYTCTVPLVGFGAIAGITLSRRKAMFIILSMWLINQGLGFTIRQYPWTPTTFAWGVVMLLGAAIATSLAFFVTQDQAKGLPTYLGQVGVTLVGGYVVYELVIWLAGFTLGGVSGFTLSILWQIFVGNAVWAMVLAGIYSVLVWRAMRLRR